MYVNNIKISTNLRNLRPHELILFSSYFHIVNVILYLTINYIEYISTESFHIT